MSGGQESSTYKYNMLLSSLYRRLSVLVLVDNLQSSKSNTQMVVVAHYFGDMIRLLKILNESASAVSAGSLFQAEINLGANELRNSSVEQ